MSNLVKPQDVMLRLCIVSYYLANLDWVGTMASMINKNKWDYFISLLSSFVSLKEKLDVKMLGPYRPKDIKILQKEKKQNQHFSVTWFQRKEGLTGGLANKSLSCFKLWSKHLMQGNWQDLFKLGFFGGGLFYNCLCAKNRNIMSINSTLYLFI